MIDSQFLQGCIPKLNLIYIFLKYFVFYHMKKTRHSNRAYHNAQILFRAALSAASLIQGYIKERASDQPVSGYPEPLSRSINNMLPSSSA